MVVIIIVSVGDKCKLVDSRAALIQIMSGIKSSELINQAGKRHEATLEEQTGELLANEMQAGILVPRLSW